MCLTCSDSSSAVPSLLFLYLTSIRSQSFVIAPPRNRRFHHANGTTWILLTICGDKSKPSLFEFAVIASS